MPDPFDTAKYCTNSRQGVVFYAQNFHSEFTCYEHLYTFVAHCLIQTKSIVLIRTTVIPGCLAAMLLLSSCAAFKPAASTEAASDKTRRPVKPSDRINSAPATKRVYKVTHDPAYPEGRLIVPDRTTLLLSGDVETSNWLQFKYAISLDVMVEALSNTRLLAYMDEWYGTRYRYGGTTKTGIDCSAFSSSLIAAVYQLVIPRTVREQYQMCRHVEPYELQEGDLVFFNTKGPFTHVGVYLVSGKFVHASVSGGVVISDLNESYYLKRFAGAGRVR